MPMDDLLKYLLKKGGSDLHLIAGLPPAIRLHGHIVQISVAAGPSKEQLQKLTYDILTPQQIELFEMDPDTRNELDFAYSLAGVGRFRFNVYRHDAPEKLDIKILHPPPRIDGRVVHDPIDDRVARLDRPAGVHPLLMVGEIAHMVFKAPSFTPESIMDLLECFLLAGDHDYVQPLRKEAR